MTSPARHLVLVGLMGAGKTTVGRACARRLGWPFVDTDDMVVERTGCSIPELFSAEGEEGFRAHEADAVLDAAGAARSAVIACGGGAPMSAENRAVLRSAGTVVWLDAPGSVLATRVDSGEARPLLAGCSDRALELGRLAQVRRSAYDAVAHATVDARRPLDMVVDAVLAALAPGLQRIDVLVDPRPYEVLVGSNAASYAASVLGARRRVAIVTQAALLDPHAARVETALSGAGINTRVFEIDDGEVAKSLPTVGRLAGELAEWGVARDDALVAVGGGVVGDTAGFAAAVYHRGVDVVQVPTTLLAMVDAAIGGKTAVNLEVGKNLVGAFHQPVAVLCDPGALESLPEREFRSGLGEVAKYALSGHAALRELLERDAAAVTARVPDVLSEVVRCCAQAKARVVADDPFERSGARAVLNYGHTFGHALETVGRYDLRHGEAIAVGLVFSAELAATLERITRAEVNEHRRVLEALNLPTEAPPGLEADELLAVMRRDKKAAGGLTFMLAGAEGIERVEDPDRAAIGKALAAVGVIQ